MTLSEQVDKDFIVAYKDKDEVKSSVLRLLKSAIKNEEISRKGPLNDGDAIKIVQREIKQRKDSIEQYEKGGRADLAEKEKNEITILEAYLPAQLTNEDIEAIVAKATAEDKDFGKIMGKVMGEVAGKADGGRVSQIVRKVLGQ